MRNTIQLFILLLAFVTGGAKAALAQMLTGFDSDPYERQQAEGGEDVTDETGEPSDAPQRKDVSDNAKPSTFAKPERAAEAAAPATYRPGLLTAPYVEDEVPVNDPQNSQNNTPSSTGQAQRGEFDPLQNVPEEGQAARPLTTQTLANNSPSRTQKENAPVDLIADSLSHDDKTNVVTASGNVMLEQAGRILRADQINYYVDEDRVVASGNVVLNEESGDIYLADDVEFTQELKNGFVEGLNAYLADGSRLSAKEGERIDGNETIAHSARYTACEPCKENPEKAPVWQIRAAKVTHDEEDARISYKHARFEVYGVPVLYTPYFSHADGTVQRKSGFVSPTLGYDSVLGANAGIDYYWAIAPDKDATIGVTYYSEENPMVTGQWRQRWKNASLQIDGGATYSSRTDNSAGQNKIIDDELRGHIFAEGLWDIDNKWRAGLDVEHVSDDQYLRQYDLKSEDVLESQVYIERFSGRNYAVGRLLKFQDVRIREEQDDQPEVLPEVIASFVGDAGAVPVIGGRWDLTTSLLGLRRDGNGRDMNRMSVDAGWERRLISDLGLVLDVEGSVRADAYNIRDRNKGQLLAGQDTNSTETRIFPQLHVQAGYPLVKAMESGQVVVEPKMSMTAAPNIGVNDDIPNEDSQDVQIDSSNLFEPNRFPGLDRVEDQSRMTYGVKSGVYGHDGSHFDVFAGQSVRLDDGDNPFPRGSGLDNRSSDYVGEISAGYKDLNYLNYRFQLNADDFYSQRHELYSQVNYGRFRLGTQYLYASALEETDISESREQIWAGLGVYFNEDWRGRIGATQDLGQAPGLRHAYVGLDYFGQCLNWSFDAERSLTDDASGDSELEFTFRIGLKNLGEYKTSDYTAENMDEGE